MPSLTNKFTPAVGPIIQVGIALPGQGAGVQPSLFPALMDTGASTTCIAQAVAASLNLPMLGMGQMASATHAQTAVPLYIGDLIIPFGTVLYIMSSTLMEFEPGNSPFSVLLGRDILCAGVLTMSFDGHLTFSI